MDNTPNIPQQPAQPTQPASPQDMTGNVPQILSPTVASVDQQQTPNASEEKHITLDDLYGPSGMADNAQPLSPLSAQPTVSAPRPPAAAPVPSQFVPPATSSVPPPVQPAPEPVPEAQPFAASNIPQPGTSAVPDLPTIGAVPPHDLPRRNQTFQATTPQRVVIPPEPPANDPPSEVKNKVNKLSLFKMVFVGIGALVLLVFIVLGIQAFTVSSQPAASGKVTLTYWGLWEDPNTMQSIISEFEQSHPNISIQYEKEDPKEYSQRLLTRINQGNGPDIFTFHSSWLPMVQPVLVPLPTSVISKNDLEKNYYPVVRNDLVKNGALYGIPLGIDTLSLFVNNKIFQAAKAQVPTTWDTFVSTARALTVRDNNGKIKVAGAAMGTFDNITHAPDILSMLFMQNGVDVTQMEPTSNAVDALNFYTSFASGDSAVWDNTLDPSMLAFARENLAMYFGYSWDIFLIKASNPSLDFSVYPVPHLPGRNTTAASYWVQGISAKSPHQKEALEFLQFLAQKNTVAQLYSEEAKTRLFGEPYPRSDLGTTLQSNPLVYPFVEQATDAKSTFFAGETDDTTLNGQMNVYLGNAVRSVLGNTSADSAINTLLQGVQQIEKQYGSG